MADRKTKPPALKNGKPSAEMIALLREKQGAPLALHGGMEEGLGTQYAPAMSDKYQPRPLRLGPSDMPRNPATEIALLNEQTGGPRMGAQGMLEEGLPTQYAPAKPLPMPGMRPRFEQPPSKAKVPPEVLIATLRGR